MLIATTETATVPVSTSDHRKILVQSLPFIRLDQQSIRRPQTVHSDFRYQDTASRSTIAALSPVNKVLSHPSLTPSQWLAVAYCSARIALLPSQNASEESSHWHHLQIKSVCWTQQPEGTSPNLHHQPSLELGGKHVQFQRACTDVVVQMQLRVGCWHDYAEGMVSLCHLLGLPDWLRVWRQTAGHHSAQSSSLGHMGRQRESLLRISRSRLAAAGGRKIPGTFSLQEMNEATSLPQQSMLTSTLKVAMQSDTNTKH